MKHVITLTTSNPAHEHVSLRRKQSTTNFMVEAADEQTAILRATAHFRRLGHYIHEAKVFKKKDQLSEGAVDATIALAGKALPVALRVAQKELPAVFGKLPSVISTAGKELAVVRPATSSAARQVAAQARTQTTNLGSVVKPTAPAAKVVVPPVVKSVPVSTTTVPVSVKPAMNPLVAAGTVATGLLGLANQVKQASSEPKVVTDVATETMPKTQTQTQTAPVQPPPPTSTSTKTKGGRPKIADLDLPGIGLGNRGDEDIQTLRQYRGGPLYQFHDFSSQNRRINEGMGSAKNAIGRVLAKRKLATKLNAEAEQNKINMEPKLTPAAGSKI